jgi:hypothetical protein
MNTTIKSLTTILITGVLATSIGGSLTSAAGPFTGSDSCAGYTDISSTDPSCEAIQFAGVIGAITGNPDKTFAPDSYLQRDQIAKIAIKAFAKFDDKIDYCAGALPFTDVVQASWAYQYICRAKALGVVTGYMGGSDKGYYRPERYVNKVEFLAIMLRNLSETMPNGASYNDVDPNEWFGPYAKFSQVNSLFEGPDLYPSRFTTRREVADIILKLQALGKLNIR